MNYIKWEKLADKYNNLWVQKYSLGPTRREVSKIIVPLLKENPELKWLDIGCGTGQLISIISKDFPDINYLGMDVAKNMVENASKATTGKNIRFVVTPIEEFNTDEKYDIITCMHAFPYFPDKPGVIRKFASLLSDNGQIIIVNSSTNNPWDLLVNFGLKFTTSKAKYLSIKQMKKLFAASGLKEKNISVIKDKWYMPTIALMDVEKNK